MEEQLRKALELERLLRDFRAVIALSYGWWFSNRQARAAEAFEEWEQPFPLTGLVFARFKKKIWKMLEQRQPCQGPFDPEKLPPWLNGVDSRKPDEFVRFVDLVFQITAESVRPLAPALLNGMHDQVLRAAEDIRKLVDWRIERISR